MPHPSEPRLLVLHALRLKGFAPAEGIASATGLTPDAVHAHLDRLVADEQVLHRDGRISGYALTAIGRSEHTRLLGEELDAAACKGGVAKGYGRFLTMNESLLKACTTWQLRTVDGADVPNDHSDPAHDAKAVAELQSLNERVQPVCAELGELLTRYAGYGPRLSAAADKVAAGDRDWFTKPIIDSYHTVWFELHEDLLSTLGIERGKESIPG